MTLLYLFSVTIEWETKQREKRENTCTVKFKTLQPLNNTVTLGLYWTHVSICVIQRSLNVTSKNDFPQTRQGTQSTTSSDLGLFDKLVDDSRKTQEWRDNVAIRLEESKPSVQWIGSLGVQLHKQKNLSSPYNYNYVAKTQRINSY